MIVLFYLYLKSYVYGVVEKSIEIQLTNFASSLDMN